MTAESFRQFGPSTGQSMPKLPEPEHHAQHRCERTQELQGGPKIASMPPPIGSATFAAMRWPPDHTAFTPHTP